ncbi:replication initiator protein [Dipodfec virus UOA04_Rod_660]|nr:replication initiator protein [Dipodfec virus UOA04_Rod_660]
MACSHPIWIRNRRYFDPKNPCRAGSDYARSSLALRPWDVARQYILVPCGKCEDCLRRLRNDWFVRIERELARCKAEHTQAIFITITIAPRYYELALLNPASFIRKWNERIRHRLGHSFKHCFFQEFGTHPHIGTEPRLHFHGFLFGANLSYNSIRKAVSDLGFVWLSNATHKRARYCVKYVVKQLNFDYSYASNHLINYNGTPTPLSHILVDRRYSRKFVSAGLGDYLGTNPRPDSRTFSWSYTSLKNRVTYNYSIPRYYNKYLESSEEVLRSVASSDSYARFSRSPLVACVLSELTKRMLLGSTLSRRETYLWQLKNYNKLHSGTTPSAAFEPPAWLNSDILTFWRDNYSINLTS